VHVTSKSVPHSFAADNGSGASVTLSSKSGSVNWQRVDLCVGCIASALIVRFFMVVFP
jgi:hypothetical protein